MERADGPEALLARAEALRRAGRTEEAIAAYRCLLALRPDLADSWFNLAWLQRRAGRFEDALASYEQALERGVGRPEEVHLNRAAIYSEHLGRPDAAEAALAAALAANPRFVPAWLNLGGLHEDHARRAAARDAYERVLALEPRHALALTRLAGLSSLAGSQDPVIGRIREAILASGTDSGRADLGFALGQTLDAVGAYDDAFVAFAAANRASRRSAGPDGARYDRSAAERLIDRLIAAFPGPACARAPDDGQAPLFICGMFRSGSTLTERILASHSGVSAGGELPLLPALVASRLQPYPEAAAAAATETLESLRAAYMTALRSLVPGGGLVTDKRPDNFLHIGLIKALFPAARIVHTRRNPLDNVLSVYFLHLHHSMAYALDLADAAHWYIQYRRLMDHWETIYPTDIHDVDYECLVDEPAMAIQGLLAFCDLEWEPGCLSFHDSRDSVRTASLWQVREPLHRRSVGRWRHYRAHLAAVRDALEACL